MRGITSKNVLLTIAGLAVLTYLFIPIKTKWTPPGPDVTVVQFWHPWTGEYADALTEVVAEFNKTHPQIRVLPLFMPSGAGEFMKFFIAVAGGVPPDVVVVDGTLVASWAELGTLQPLEDRLARAGIKAEDFWGPSWKQCQYAGHSWALSAAADANFALVWNKSLFRQAGLDPERPPRTLKELEEYSLKLTQHDEQGYIKRLGIMPTYTSDPANTLLTWGWIFGGEFFNEETNEFTCDSPRVVKSLEWLLYMRDLHGGKEKLRAFQSGFGEAVQNPFYLGKLAMHISYIAETQNIHKFAPNLEYGIAPMPGPEDGEIGSAWLGGWTIAIPKGNRGHDDQAFELIRWMCADPVGTTIMSRKMKLLPAYRKSPFFTEDVPRDPILSAYYKILQNARHYRPITPANASYITELRRAMSRAFESAERNQTPEGYLREARRNTTQQLERILARSPFRHNHDMKPPGGPGGEDHQQPVIPSEGSESLGEIR